MKMKDTLHLGKTAFPMKANLPVRELEWQKEWEEKDIYVKLEKDEEIELKSFASNKIDNINIYQIINDDLNKIQLKFKQNQELLEEKKFEMRAYDKAELALLYCPGRSEETALKTMMRWIRQCEPLMEALDAIGYNCRRHRFLRREVEQIVRHLGEP